MVKRSIKPFQFLPFSFFPWQSSRWLTIPPLPLPSPDSALFFWWFSSMTSMEKKKKKQTENSDGRREMKSKKTKKCTDDGKFHRRWKGWNGRCTNRTGLSDLTGSGVMKKLKEKWKKSKKLKRGGYGSGGRIRGFGEGENGIIEVKLNESEIIFQTIIRKGESI